MEFINIKHGKTNWVEVYYEGIHKLVHGLQTLTTNNFLTIVFKARLQSYLTIAIVGVKQTTLQHHKEATLLCEEGMTLVEAQSTLLVLKVKKIVATPKPSMELEKTSNTTQTMVEIITM
jgi:hypothetical protein